MQDTVTWLSVKGVPVLTIPVHEPLSNHFVLQPRFFLLFCENIFLWWRSAGKCCPLISLKLFLMFSVFFLMFTLVLSYNCIFLYVTSRISKFSCISQNHPAFLCNRLLTRLLCLAALTDIHYNCSDLLTQLSLFQQYLICWNAEAHKYSISHFYRKRWRKPRSLESHGSHVVYRIGQPRKYTFMDN